jgi:transcriptional regulator with XRE-family HTH domain
MLEIERTYLLRDALKKLILQSGISDAELAKKTGIPESTIYRLTSGATNDPRISTLRILADFFGITLGQLVGEEPLNAETELQAGKTKKLYKIPMITWNQVIHWHALLKKINEKTHSTWVYSDQVTSPKSFSILIETDQYGPPFLKNSIIFVDSSISLKSTCFAVFSEKETKRSGIKKVIEDTSGIYLLHPGANSIISKFNKEKDIFIGVITGLKIFYHESLTEDLHSAE